MRVGVFGATCIFAVLVIVPPACRKPSPEVDDSGRCNPIDGADHCERVKARLRRECEAGSDAAPCLALGDAIEHWSRTVAEVHGARREAMPWYEKACERGEGAGCFWLGGWFADAPKGPAFDPARARASFEKGCTLRSPEACDAMGDCFLHVRAALEGVCPKDLAMAKEMYGRACDIRKKTRIGCESAENVDRMMKP